MKTTLSTDKALTTSFVAATNAHRCEGKSYHTLKFLWTPGTAANVLTIKVYARDKGVTDGSLVQQQKWTESGTAGTYTKTLIQYQETATGTTEVPLEIEFQRHADEILVYATESEAGSSTKGTYTASITSSFE